MEVLLLYCVANVDGCVAALGSLAPFSSSLQEEHVTRYFTKRLFSIAFRTVDFDAACGQRTESGYRGLGKI